MNQQKVRSLLLLLLFWNNREMQLYVKSWQILCLKWWKTLKQTKETSAKVAIVCCCAAVAVEINKTETSQVSENDLTQQEKTCFFYRTLNRNAAISQLYFMDILKNRLDFFAQIGNGYLATDRMEDRKLNTQVVMN